MPVYVAKASWSRNGAGVRRKRSVGSSVLIERVCVKDERRVAAFGWVKAAHFSTANRIAYPLRTFPLGVPKREQHSAILD